MLSRASLLLISFLLILSLGGCDLDYWWSRGQPPSSQKLLTRADIRLNETLGTTARTDVKEDAQKIRADLTELNDALAKGQGGAKVSEGIVSLSSAFSALEGKLSFGSRAPYGELLDQLQGFQKISEENGTVDKNTFALYSARTLFFLASELSVPAPVIHKAG